MEQVAEKRLVPRRTVAKRGARKAAPTNGEVTLTKPERYPIERNLTNHPPSKDVQAVMEEYRGKVKTLARWMDRNLPEGREKSLAFTKLEEMVMQAIAALARDGH